MLWKKENVSRHCPIASPVPASILFSVFFFFLLRLIFYSCLFADIKAVLVLLKMTALSSVSYFHVIYNWNTPSSQPHQKNRVGERRRKNRPCRPPRLTSNRMIGFKFRKILLFCSFRLKNNRERGKSSH